MGITPAGISTVLLAIGVLLPTLGSFIVSMVVLRRQGENKVQTDQKLTHLTMLTNGQSEKLNALTAKASHAEGVKEGGDAERAKPTGPRGPLHGR